MVLVDAMAKLFGCGVLQRVRAASEVKCWGKNDCGQLGQGRTQPTGDSASYLRSPKSKMEKSFTLMILGGETKGQHTYEPPK